MNRVLLIGSVAELGDVWLDAVRDEAKRRALGLLADATVIERGRDVDHVVALGATALLMTRELRPGAAAMTGGRVLAGVDIGGEQGRRADR